MSPLTPRAERIILGCFMAATAWVVVSAIVAMAGCAETRAVLPFVAALDGERVACRAADARVPPAYRDRAIALCVEAIKLAEDIAAGTGADAGTDSAIVVKDGGA